MLKSLHTQARPFAVFDPTNEEHRRCYQQFLKLHSWKTCPHQWIIDDDCMSVVHNIEKKIVNFYLNTEFARKRKVLPEVLKIKDIKSQIRR